VVLYSTLGDPDGAPHTLAHEGRSPITSPYLLPPAVTPLERSGELRRCPTTPEKTSIFLAALHHRDDLHPPAAGTGRTADHRHPWPAALPRCLTTPPPQTSSSAGRPPPQAIPLISPSGRLYLRRR
jgi:hypothetical protein